jgi:hypothetical protein
MSWSFWNKNAPTPPPGKVWSAVDPELQVCTEIQRAPDACAQQVLKNVYSYLNPGLVPDIQPVSCVQRGYKRQVLDPEVLQGTYLYQVQSINSPCNVEPYIYIVKYMP